MTTAIEVHELTKQYADAGYAVAFAVAAARLFRWD